uniref:Uncharacterized protein n=3 Tax=Schistocephalus solidus TaxID=70667 RepID=A0A0X3Q102_SCHSO
MGNCCIYLPYRPKFLRYFTHRNDPPILSGDSDTLMDLDFLEEPQLAFRINERPFTVSSYLNWVSNKPRTILPINDRSSAESSVSSRRGAGVRSSLSRIMSAGMRTYSPPSVPGENSSSDATERLLFKEVDPKGRPPPAQIASSPSSPPEHNGNWAAVTSVSGREHKTSTSAVFLSNKAAERHRMSHSLYSERSSQQQEEEVDGPELARLMRRYWPRDFNFFGLSSAHSSGAGNSRRSLCESTGGSGSGRRSSASSHPQRPTVLNLRSDMSDGGSMTEPGSFSGDFESTLDLDWDHEPGAFGLPETTGVSNRFGFRYTSPFDSTAANDSLFCTGRPYPLPRRRACRTLPRASVVREDLPILTPSKPSNTLGCAGGAKMTKTAQTPMVDSGFVGYETATEGSVFSPNSGEATEDLLWKDNPTVGVSLSSEKARSVYS